MPSAPNLENKRFGRWVVRSRVEDHITRGTRRRSKWCCLCDCGAEKAVFGENLIRGLSKSCGCLKIEKTSAAKAKDYTGLLYGTRRVTTPTQHASTRSGFRIWNYECTSCGRAGLVSTERFWEWAKLGTRCICHSTGPGERALYCLVQAHYPTTVWSARGLLPPSRLELDVYVPEL